jgi:hypothetical protein
MSGVRPRKRRRWRAPRVVKASRPVFKAEGVFVAGCLRPLAAGYASGGPLTEGPEVFVPRLRDKLAAQPIRLHSRWEQANLVVVNELSTPEAEAAVRKMSADLVVHLDRHWKRELFRAAGLDPDKPQEVTSVTYDQLAAAYAQRHGRSLPGRAAIAYGGIVDGEVQA